MLERILHVVVLTFLLSTAVTASPASDPRSALVENGLLPIAAKKMGVPSTCESFLLESRSVERT